MDDNTFHKIPVTFFDESYNNYQNEELDAEFEERRRV